MRNLLLRGQARVGAGQEDWLCGGQTIAGWRAMTLCSLMVWRTLPTKSLPWVCFILLTHCLSPVGAFPHPAGRESEEEQASQAPARSCLLICSDSPQPRLTCGMALIQFLPLVQPLLGHEGPRGEEEHAFGSVDPSSIPGLPLTSCSS